jgi:EEF1A lysine methyltransferase 2
MPPSWDKLYEAEISNHTTDPSDLGTIWFDDSSAEDTLLAFLHSPSLALSRAHTSFLDIGTGNGHFLFRLREPFPPDEDSDEEEDGEQDGTPKKRTGFQGRIVGTDYSHQSIEFATRIAASRVPPVVPAIEFLQHDIMASSPSAVLTSPNEAGYDVVLDKGTFDAISLSEERLPLPDGVEGDNSGGGKNGNGNGKRLCEGYKDRIVPLVKEGGVFLITSCNWTEEELKGWFGGGPEELAFETGLKYRSFRFGGREGQSISSVCFRKRKI